MISEGGRGGPLARPAGGWFLAAKRAVIVGGGGGGDAAAFALPKRGFEGGLVWLGPDRDRQAVRGPVERGSGVVLVGAGFIGAEVPASARQMGKEVLMVESAPVPLARALGVEVGEVYASVHRDRGVDVRTGTTVTEWHSYGGRIVGATLSDGRREDVDVVLVAIGIDPNLDVPRALGLQLDGGGVKVDEGLNAADGVYIAGDIAFHSHPVLRPPIRVEDWEVGTNQ